MNKRIYIKDWLLFKPYDRQKITDSYYLKLSNDVKQAITTNKQSFVLQMYLDEEDFNHLACFLTSRSALCALRSLDFSFCFALIDAISVTGSVPFNSGIISPPW